MARDADLAAMAPADRSPLRTLMVGTTAAGDLLLCRRGIGPLYFQLIDYGLAIALPLSAGWVTSSRAMTVVAGLLTVQVLIHWIECHVRTSSPQHKVHHYSPGASWSCLYSVSQWVPKVSKTPGAATFFAQGVLEPLVFVVVAYFTASFGYVVLALYLQFLAVGLVIKNTSRFSTMRRRMILTTGSSKEREIHRALNDTLDPSDPVVARDVYSHNP